jgi:glycosyltransferase involved in cell wall biosynthesis
MDSGSGVPMKILEAWSAALPVVVHPWAASGLAGEGSRCVEIAVTPDQWIEALVEILTNDKKAREMGDRGREVWERHYCFERVAHEIRTAVEEAKDSLR